MSIMDEGIIDFAGLEEDAEGARNLVLTIFDNLAWGVEADDVHLLMLQNKINDYLRYVESGEVDSHFEPQKYDKVVIRIISEHPFSSECIRFLELSKPVIEEAGFGLEWTLEISIGYGNYTEEREELPDHLTIDDIVTSIDARKDGA